MFNMRFGFIPLACGYLALAVSPLRVSAFNRPLRVARLHVKPATVASATTAAEVVVVGGGPGGLASALELRRRLPQTSVVVIERQSSLNAFDPERAFLYLIDGRGQKFTDAHNLTDKVRARGVSFDGNSGFNVTVCPPDAPRKEVSLQLVDRQRKIPYWIARNEFVEILADAVTEDPGIVVLAGHACEGLHRQPEGGFVLAVEPVSASKSGSSHGEHAARIARSDDGCNEVVGGSKEQKEGLRLRPRLVIAADGARSKVRTTLDAWAQADAAAAAKTSFSRHNKEEKGDRFALQVRPSPSGGLRYKVLSLPGGFPLDKPSTESGGEDSGEGDGGGGVATNAGAEGGQGGGGAQGGAGESARGTEATTAPAAAAAPASPAATITTTMIKPPPSSSPTPSFPSSADVSLYDASAIADRAPPPSSKTLSSQTSSSQTLSERAQPQATYSFRSKFQSLRRRACRLGLLPRPSIKDNRTANLITPADHVVWTDPHLRTPEGMAAFLAESFPQLPLKEAYGSDRAALGEEIRRFAQSSGGTFPEPSTTHGGVVYTWQPSSSSSSSSQTTLSASTSSLLESAPTPSSDTITTITTTTATATLATTTNTSGPSYVALIGDALHFFPPDVGQGVNSALEEALVLGQYLQEQEVGQAVESGDENLSLPATDAAAAGAAAAAATGAAGGATSTNVNKKVNWQRLGLALAQYESRCRREAAALVRIVQVANPYQYSQPGKIAKVRQAAWGLNFVLRRALAKIPLLGAESASLRQQAQSSVVSEAPQPPWWVFFHEALFVLVQRGDKLPYSDALRRANKTTTVLWTAALGAMLLGTRCVFV